MSAKSCSPNTWTRVRNVTAKTKKKALLCSLVLLSRLVCESLQDALQKKSLQNISFKPKQENLCGRRSKILSICIFWAAFYSKFLQKCFNRSGRSSKPRILRVMHYVAFCLSNWSAGSKSESACSSNSQSVILITERTGHESSPSLKPRSALFDYHSRFSQIRPHY